MYFSPSAWITDKRILTPAFLTIVLFLFPQGFKIEWFNGFHSCSLPVAVARAMKHLLKLPRSVALILRYVDKIHALRACTLREVSRHKITGWRRLSAFLSKCIKFSSMYFWSWLFDDLNVLQRIVVAKYSSQTSSNTKISIVALYSLLLLNSKMNPYAKMRFFQNVIFSTLLDNPSFLQIKDVNESLHIYGNFN